MNAAELPAPQIGRILIAAGLLTEEQLAQALEEQAQTGKRLGEIIVQRGFISGPALANALAEQHGGVLKTEYGFASGLGGIVARRAASESGAQVSPLRPPDPTPLPQLRTVDLSPAPEVNAEPTRPEAPAETPEPQAEPVQPLLQAAEPPTPATPPEPEPDRELEFRQPPAHESGPSPEPEPQFVPLVGVPQPQVRLPEPVQEAAPPPQPPEPVDVPEPEFYAAPEVAETPTPVEPLYVAPAPERERDPITAPEPVETPTPVEPFAPISVTQPLRAAPPEPTPEPEPEPAPAAAVPDDRDALIESLRARVDAQDQEIANLREQLEQERDRKDLQVHVWPEEQLPSDPETPAEPESYLLCVPTPTGYVLLDRVGVLPNVGEPVEVEEEQGRFTVTKVVRLPRNGRPCAYLQRS